MFTLMATIAMLVIFLLLALMHVFPSYGLPHYDAFHPPAQSTMGMQFKRDVWAISQAVPADDDIAFLHLCLRVLDRRYYSFINQSQLMPWRLFQRDPTEIWTDRFSVQSCNVLSFLLGCMCWVSGRFRRDDIEIDYTHNEMCCHQYLLLHHVQPLNTSLRVDPWAFITLRLPIGQYVTGVNQTMGDPVYTDFRNCEFEHCCIQNDTNPRQCTLYTLRGLHRSSPRLGFLGQAKKTFPTNRQRTTKNDTIFGSSSDLIVYLKILSLLLFTWVMVMVSAYAFSVPVVMQREREYWRAKYTE